MTLFTAARRRVEKYWHLLVIFFLLLSIVYHYLGAGAIFLFAPFLLIALAFFQAEVRNPSLLLVAQPNPDPHHPHASPLWHRRASKKSTELILLAELEVFAF